MTFLNFFQGLGVLFIGILLWALIYAVVAAVFKGGWRALVLLFSGIGRGIRALLRSPRQALVDAPFLIHLLILPFLLVYERVYGWLHPEQMRRKKATIAKLQAAAAVFQSRLGQVALYREGNTILLCKVLRFEVSEHLVLFEAEPVPQAGFSIYDKPWNFSINWEYFFYDEQCWAADYQYMRWRVNFDDERIEKLKVYAAQFAHHLEPAVRYGKLNHFFIYGKEESHEEDHRRQSVDAALWGLKAFIAGAPDAAWLQSLPQALGAQVNIMSPYAFPGYPNAAEEIKFEQKIGMMVMWVPLHPNPWRVEFSADRLLAWWNEQNAASTAGGDDA